MTAKQLVLIALLLPFLALSGYVISTVGFNGFYDEALSSPATMLMGFDLLITLGILLYWMMGDSRTSGVSAIPYVIVTLLIGAAGPLAYLIHREARQRKAAEAPA